MGLKRLSMRLLMRLVQQLVCRISPVRRGAQCRRLVAVSFDESAHCGDAKTWHVRAYAKCVAARVQD